MNKEGKHGDTNKSKHAQKENHHQPDTKSGGFDRLNSKRIASDSEYAKTIQTHQSSKISKDEIVTQSNRPVALRHTNKQTQITNNTTHKHTQTYANKLQDKEPN